MRSAASRFPNNLPTIGTFSTFPWSSVTSVSDVVICSKVIRRIVTLHGGVLLIRRVRLDRKHRAT
jgi:hypothetical protein